jgi:hypothetical protein
MVPLTVMDPAGGIGKTFGGEFFKKPFATKRSIAPQITAVAPIIKNIFLYFII